MGDKSAISWTDASWNPIRGARTGTKGMVLWGCERVSPGCDNCYASTLHRNHGGEPYVQEGGWKPIQSIKQPHAGREPLQLHEQTLLQPLRWRKPRRIFLSSMTDIFGSWVPDAWLDRIFAVMAGAPDHTFQVLTKRPKRMLEYLTTPGRERAISAQVCSQQMATGCRLYGCSEDCEMDGGFEWPLSNVWLGTSIESPYYFWRLNYLGQCPAAVRFISAEPLLDHLGGFSLEGVDWVITGGESGPGYRPAHHDWFRDLRDQCQAAGVAFFFKQSSGPKAGKGTLLDGVEWHQFPEVAS